LSTLGSRIKEYRVKRGFTQSQIANKLGMTEANFSSYERDKSAPPSDKLSQLSTILNVSSDYLLFGKNFEDHLIIRESSGSYCSENNCNDEEWTEEELQEIEQFKEFMRMKKRTRVENQ
jgi:transcriptional regulator with XRE-family HTH domain